MRLIQSKWLKDKGVLKADDMKIAAVTKDAFMAQEDMNDKSQNIQHTNVKRKLPNVDSDNTKKQRRDTQTSRSGASATVVQTESNLRYAQTLHLHPVSKRLHFVA